MGESLVSISDYLGEDTPLEDNARIRFRLPYDDKHYEAWIEAYLEDGAVVIRGSFSLSTDHVVGNHFRVRVNNERPTP